MYPVIPFKYTKADELFFGLHQSLQTWEMLPRNLFDKILKFLR